MSVQVQVKQGYIDVWFPDGYYHSQGDVFTLSDIAYANLPGGALSAITTNIAPVSPPVPGTYVPPPVDPNSPGALLSHLRRRNLPGLKGANFYPMATPPVIATHVPSANPLSQSVITSPKHYPADCGRFAIYGGRVTTSVYGGSWAYLSANNAYTLSSGSPFRVEVGIDSVGGAIELVIRNGGPVRVKLDGQYVTFPGATFNTVTADGWITVGSIYGPAGYHEWVFEFAGSANFAGINVGSNDTIRPLQRNNLKMVVVGDSVTEPTVADSAVNNPQLGFPQYLAELLGIDVWSCGSGATGFLTNGGIAGRVKTRDRLIDVVNAAPDIVLWLNGLNDGPGSGSWTTPAAFQAEVAANFAYIQTHLPNCQQIVGSQMTPRGRTTFNSTAYTLRDSIQSAALAAGLPFIDLLAPPVGSMTPAKASVLSSATIVGATTVACPITFLDPGVSQIYGTTVVQIGTGATAEIRAISSYSGSGPYSLVINEAGRPLVNAHAAGEPIVQIGESVVNGDGWQGATTGNGNSDRYTGNDSTHPTMLGHLNLAIFLYEQICALLPA